MNRRWLIALAVVFGIAVLLANTLFIVDQRQQVVVVNLGEPVRVINPPGAYDPGLKIKTPFTESLVVLDKRNQAIEAEKEDVISADQQRLVVDAFVRYRISDPVQFYRTLRNEDTAADRLKLLINSSLRQVLGAANATDIISKDRSQLMGDALRDIRARAQRSRLGIEVIDLRIKRADLPAANQEAVYQRMKSNLQQQAAQTRAEGEATRRAIVADADKQVTITLAKAYDASFSDGDTTLILSLDSDFMKYFKKGPTGR